MHVKCIKYIEIKITWNLQIKETKKAGGVSVWADIIPWPQLLCYSSHSTFQRTFLIKTTFPNNFKENNIFIIHVQHSEDFLASLML